MLISQLADWELFPHTDLWFRTIVGSLCSPVCLGLSSLILWMLKYYVGKMFI